MTVCNSIVGYFIAPFGIFFVGFVIAFVFGILQGRRGNDMFGTDLADSTLSTSSGGMDDDFSGGGGDSGGGGASGSW